MIRKELLQAYLKNSVFVECLVTHTPSPGAKPTRRRQTRSQGPVREVKPGKLYYKLNFPNGLWIVVEKSSLDKALKRHVRMVRLQKQAKQRIQVMSKAQANVREDAATSGENCENLWDVYVVAPFSNDIDTTSVLQKKEQPQMSDRVRVLRSRKSPLMSPREERYANRSRAAAAASVNSKAKSKSRANIQSKAKAKSKQVMMAIAQDAGEQNVIMARSKRTNDNGQKIVEKPFIMRKAIEEPAAAAQESKSTGAKNTGAQESNTGAQESNTAAQNSKSTGAKKPKSTGAKKPKSTAKKPRVKAVPFAASPQSKHKGSVCTTLPIAAQRYHRLRVAMAAA